MIAIVWMSRPSINIVWPEICTYVHALKYRAIYIYTYMGDPGPGAPGRDLPCTSVPPPPRGPPRAGLRAGPALVRRCPLSPGTAPDSLRYLHDSLREAQGAPRQPKRAQRRPQTASRRLQRSLRRPKRPPREPPRGPNRPISFGKAHMFSIFAFFVSTASTSAQEVPKIVPRGPQDCPRVLDDSPREPQDG